MSLLKLWGAAGALLGAALGVGAYTFTYAQGASYLHAEASACANCHVMEEHYSAWLRSSHRDVATCNDCHTASGPISKYLSKASNGVRHSFAFTAGGVPDRLRITDDNTRVTERACRSCHERITSVIEDQGHTYGASADDLSCIRCHAAVGHWVR
jgi:cytochrome c nitrite reductase small subunit